MPLIKTNAFVGSAFPSGDKDLVIHLLAREHGRLGLLIRGGNASRTGRAALLQPLAEVELTAYLREGKDLATLREVALIEPHLPLREKIDRLALASFLLDVALETSFPGQECGETYDLLRVALAAVESADESPPTTLTCHFLMRLLAVHGVEPAIHDALLTGAWKQSPGTGGSEGGAQTRKPRAFVLNVQEGLIVAAPEGFSPPQRASEPESGETREAESGRTRRADSGELGDATSPDSSGLDVSSKFPRSKASPRSYPLTPPAVRAVYENQRAPVEQLHQQPPIDPAAAAGLLRALTALAEFHLDIRPRSRRFLETTILKGSK